MLPSVIAYTNQSNVRRHNNVACQPGNHVAQKQQTPTELSAITRRAKCQNVQPQPNRERQQCNKQITKRTTNNANQYGHGTSATAASVPTVTNQTACQEYEGEGRVRQATEETENVAMAIKCLAFVTQWHRFARILNNGQVRPCQKRTALRKGRDRRRSVR